MNPGAQAIALATRIRALLANMDDIHVLLCAVAALAADAAPHFHDGDALSELVDDAATLASEIEPITDEERAEWAEDERADRRRLLDKEDRA